MRFRRQFGLILPSTSHPILKKVELKMTFDFTWISASNFIDFGLQLGPLLVPKMPPEPPRSGTRGAKKRTKIMDFWRSLLGPPLGVVLDGFWLILGMIFERFWDDFDLILGGFCEAERSNQNIKVRMIFLDFRRIFGSKAKQTQLRIIAVWALILKETHPTFFTTLKNSTRFPFLAKTGSQGGLSETQSETKWWDANI